MLLRDISANYVQSFIEFGSPISPLQAKKRHINIQHIETVKISNMSVRAYQQTYRQKLRLILFPLFWRMRREDIQT